MDFTGAVRRHEFYCDALATVAGIVSPGLPVIDEELFEWITLCDAIRTARHRFVLDQSTTGVARAVLAGRTVHRHRGHSSAMRATSNAARGLATRRAFAFSASSFSASLSNAPSFIGSVARLLILTAAPCSNR